MWAMYYPNKIKTKPKCFAEMSLCSLPVRSLCRWAQLPDSRGPSLLSLLPLLHWCNVSYIGGALPDRYQQFGKAPTFKNHESGSRK